MSMPPGIGGPDPTDPTAGMPPGAPPGPPPGGAPPEEPDDQSGARTIDHVTEMGNGVHVTFTDGTEVMLHPGDNITVGDLTPDTSLQLAGADSPVNFRDAHFAGQLPDWMHAMVPPRPSQTPADTGASFPNLDAMQQAAAAGPGGPTPGMPGLPGGGPPPPAMPPPPQPGAGNPQLGMPPGMGGPQQPDPALIALLMRGALGGNKPPLQGQPTMPGLPPGGPPQ